MNEKHTLTQKQLQELSVRYQQYQSQAESIAQQMNMVQLTIRDVDTALVTIEALKDQPAGKEIMVPIGFGTMVKATLTDTSKVVIGIGAGVSVEKKLEDAKALLEKRKEELTKYHERLNNTIAKLAQEMQNIQKLVQRHIRSQEQSQQPMNAE